MLETERAKAPVVVVDAGNALWKGAILSESDRGQEERKATLIAESYALVGIDAMGVGDGELAFGLPWLQALQKQHNLPYVAANLDCGGEHPFEAGKVVERGGLRIGIVGLVGNSAKVQGCLASEPIAAAEAAFAKLGTVDIRILLSTQQMADDQRVAEKLPDLDFIVNGGERRENLIPEPLSTGGLLLAGGSRGKKVGMLSFDSIGTGHDWRDAGALGELARRKDATSQRIKEAEEKLAKSEDPKEQARLKTRIEYYKKQVIELEKQLGAATAGGASRSVENRFVELGTDVADHPATAALVARAKEEISALVGIVKPTALGTGPFVGSAACLPCHAAQASQWSTTPHARAYASLGAQNRQKDEACYSCHVTGAFHPDGPHSPGVVGGLENVGCESCHGPGRDHVATPASVDMVAKPEMAVCTQCHDGVKDEGRFDPVQYLVRVSHTSPHLEAPSTNPAPPVVKP